MSEPHPEDAFIGAIFLVLTLITPALLLLGWVAGAIRERTHFKQLAEREQALADMTVTNLKSYQPAARGDKKPEIVIGEVVIATDYWKTMLAKIRNIFGGRVGSYVRLTERARREGILRVLEGARAKGHNAVCNVRMETADIGGTTANKKGAAMVAIIVWATAYSLPTKGKP